jgi:hypothetical protein
MTRRLARYENGQPPIQRWGGERPRPTGQTALSTGSKGIGLPKRLWTWQSFAA